MDRESTSKTTSGKESGTARKAKAKVPAARKAKAPVPETENIKPAARKTGDAAKPQQKMQAKPEVKQGVKQEVKADLNAGKKAEVKEKEKVRKIKLVRDSFTMPESEYAVLGEVKKACLKAGLEVKKSELLRVGVALLRELDAARIQAVLANLPALKAGRPKKNK